MTDRAGSSDHAVDASPSTTGSTQAGCERRLSRRGALQTLGVSLTGGATLAAASAPVRAAASVDAFADAKPNHVDITTDSEFLNTYRPLLDLTNVRWTNYPTLRGWKVTSPERETDVAVYAAEYAVQKDVISLTSHAGDHEWIYVFTDSANGEVRAVSYTAYHWLRGWVQNPPTATEGGTVTDSGTHPMFLIAPTYHNYAPLPTPQNGVLLDVSSLGDYSSRSGPLYQWLANGMNEDMEPGAVHNPWTLAPNGPLDAWWSETGSGRLNRWIVSAWAFIGFTVGIGWRGSDHADFGGASL